MQIWSWVKIKHNYFAKNWQRVKEKLLLYCLGTQLEYQFIDKTQLKAFT